MRYETLLIYGLFWAAQGAVQCPDGWENYFGTENVCVKGFREQKSWIEAYSYCKAGNNGSLVSIHNAFQNAHIASMTVALAICINRFTAEFFILERLLQLKQRYLIFRGFLEWGGLEGNCQVLMRRRPAQRNTGKRKKLSGTLLKKMHSIKAKMHRGQWQPPRGLDLPNGPL